MGVMKRRGAALLAQVVLGAVMFFGATAAALAGTVTVTGTIPKIGNQIQVTFNITDVTPTFKAKGDSETAANDDASFAGRFKIQITQCDASAALPFVATAVTDTKCHAYVRLVSHTGPDQDANGNFSYTYTATIEGTDGNFRTEIDRENKLQFKVFFYLGDATKPEANIAASSKDDQSSVLTLDASVIDTAPQLANVTGTNAQLVVAWAPQATVTVKKKEGNSSSAAGPIAAFFIDSTILSQGSLTAHHATLDIKEDDTVLPDACTFAEPGTDNQCVTCTGENIYLDPNDFTDNKVAGVKVISPITSSLGNASATGLINDHKYWVFLQYVQGIQRSSCLSGTPTPNFSMSELNGEGEATHVDFRCFIATAAYGSPLHADVRLFRKFRDKILLRHAMGRSFVRWYYKHSPPAAEFIARHPMLRAVTRGVLEVPALILRQWDDGKRPQ